MKNDQERTLRHDTLYLSITSPLTLLSSVCLGLTSFIYLGEQHLGVITVEFVPKGVLAPEKETARNGCLFRGIATPDLSRLMSLYINSISPRASLNSLITLFLTLLMPWLRGCSPV